MRRRIMQLGAISGPLATFRNGRRWPQGRRAWITVAVAAGSVLALVGVLVFVLIPMFGPGLDPHTLSTLDPKPITQNASQVCQHAAQAANPVAAENTCQGTNSWTTDHSLGATNDIMAYTLPESVNQGQDIKFYISTTAPAYTFQVFRMGWYQGLGGRLMYTSPRISGINQPAPLFDAKTRTWSCTNWRDPVTLHVPTSWVSGVYLVKLVSSFGHMRYSLFVVRNDASHSSLLVQMPFLTYQAYNNWGNRSLYVGPGTTKTEISQNRSYMVSFDRPYTRSAGAGDFGLYDYNTIRWFERQGYDLSYTTDQQVDQQGKLLLNHRLLVVSGHAEYWTAAMRQNVTAARDAGVSLAFMGANDIYWHVRLQDDVSGHDRDVICYKDAALDSVTASDPTNATVHWRDPQIHNPENRLMGAMYTGIGGAKYPLVLADGAAPFLQGTGLSSGDSLPGLIGGEFDRVWTEPAYAVSFPVTILSNSFVKCDESCTTTVSNSTLYTAPSGARVFDAGSFKWVWGLDDATFPASDPPHSFSTAGFQRFTQNIIGYLLDAHGASGSHA